MGKITENVKKRVARAIYNKIPIIESLTKILLVGLAVFMNRRFMRRIGKNKKQPTRKFVMIATISPSIFNCCCSWEMVSTLTIGSGFSLVGCGSFSIGISSIILPISEFRWWNYLPGARVFYWSIQKMQEIPLVDIRIQPEEITIVENSQPNERRPAPVLYTTKSRPVSENVQPSIPQPRIPTIKPSTLAPVDDEQVIAKTKELKTKIFPAEKRRVIQDLCRENSISCKNAKILLDLFRISFEKVLSISSHLEIDYQ